MKTSAIKRTIWLILGLSLLSACGQKGPLFMPEPAQSNQPSPQSQPNHAEEVKN
ncbi:LPS translocon maturation chaperone LptM [Neptunicella sp.]|uniref:LPS translocon maturation chaperone LptM n=1 Tax=Neptunicella sp. TaxID=2125986 RepID=UPI003F68C9FE